MTLVKGPNGLIVDVAPSVASGLIGGGHVIAVDAEAKASPADQAETTDTDNEPTDPTKPGGNASKQAWYDYALAQGFAEEQLDGLKQGEIRALFDE